LLQQSEILDTVRANVALKLIKIRIASSIPVSHGLVQAGIALGRTTYGSPPFDQSVLVANH
jgi:acetylornithine deacetylase